MSILYKKLECNKQFELFYIKDEYKNNIFKECRHDFYQLIFITKGEGKHCIDFEEYELKRDLVYLIKPSQVHKWHLNNFNNEYDGYIFNFSKEFFHDDKIINNLFNNNVESSINICNKTKKNLTLLVEMIKEEYLNNDDFLLLSHLFSSFLKYIIKSKTNIAKSLNTDKRVENLKILIDQHYKEEKSASFYAKKFDLTTKRLNEIIQNNINKTVSDLISERLIVEAKRELIFSQESVKDIAEALGYFDASYFSRFFKNHTKLCPKEFRANNLKIYT
ncbi:MAG: helix-turn-helix domain-containing protein [Campylobacteraceae bacterium]|nr:helix-turn-helix domain-containing protein [Campylobacteraceae bacterium]